MLGEHFWSPEQWLGFTVAQRERKASKKICFSAKTHKM